MTTVYEFLRSPRTRIIIGTIRHTHTRTRVRNEADSLRTKTFFDEIPTPTRAVIYHRRFNTPHAQSVTTIGQRIAPVKLKRPLRVNCKTYITRYNKSKLVINREPRARTIGVFARKLPRYRRGNKKKNAGSSRIVV